MYKLCTIFVWSGKSTNRLWTREGAPICEWVIERGRVSLSPDPAFLITFEKIKSRIVVNQSVDDADSDDIDVFFSSVSHSKKGCITIMTKRTAGLCALLWLPQRHCSRHWTAFLFLDFVFPPFPFFPLISSFFIVSQFASGIFPPHFFPLFFSAVTLFAPLNCLPILIFCFSSFPLFFPLILSFFLEVCESYPPFWNIGASASSFYFLVLFNSDLSLLVLYCRQRQMWCGGFWLQLSPLALLWFPMRHSTPKPTSLYTIARLLINGMKLFLDLVLCFCAFLFWAVQEIRWSFAFATYILGLLYL